MQMNDRHYWVLAEVLKRLTSRSVVDLVYEQFDHLNMTATTVNHTAAALYGELAGNYVRQGIDSSNCATIWHIAGKMDRSCYGYPVATEWFVEGPGLFIPGPIISSFADMVSPSVSRVMDCD